MKRSEFMQCPSCQNEARKFGKDRHGNQRYQCLTCRKTFSDLPAKPLDEMRLPRDKTLGWVQIDTDGWKPYKTAIPAIFDSENREVDHAVVVKDYGKFEDDHRYSPSEVLGIDVYACCGEPNLDKACTSHIERQNLTIRMQNRRMTRLTNAFSKKWANHQASLALHFATYNFITPHGTLTKKTGA